MLIIILALVLLGGCIPSDPSPDTSAPSSNESDASSDHADTPSSHESASDLHTVQKIKEIKFLFDAHILLTESGEVYTWGRNNQGALGLGLPEGEIVLTPKKVAIEDKIKTIEVNANSNSVYAISTQGNVYAWGPNHYSIFPGVEDYHIYRPVKIEFPFEVNAIRHSFRYLTVEDKTGDLYGCGWDGEGGAILPEEARKSVSSDELQLLYKNDGDFIAHFYNADFNRTYLNQDGDVFLQGILVYPQTTLHSNFTEIDFPETIVKVGSLFQGMVCLSDTGNLYFIGEDRFGIAGITPTPNTVGSQIYDKPTKITKLSEKIIDFEVSTTSIIVRTEDNQFYTWGYNLGRNAAESDDEFISTPNRIDIPEDIVYYHCGQFSGVAISAEGTIYAWGSNGNFLFSQEEYMKRFEPRILHLEKLINAN